MNEIDNSIVLYYADFLSLLEISIPVTDNCKYYFIYDKPINCAYIVDKLPFYNKDNLYYIQALDEYKNILKKYKKDGLNSYINRICNLQSLGCIGANLMLNCIHLFSDKYTRKQAFKVYQNWYNNRKYSHLVKDDNGDIYRERCSEYVARIEQGTWTEPSYDC